MKHTVLITGAAGYVGAMLVERLARREDVEKIIGLDKEPAPDLIVAHPKLIYVQANTIDSWEEKVRVYAPDIVIHTAWQIRELYGNKKLEWQWNIEGSDRVFDFAFGEGAVHTLVHFSTVASYGAFSTNTIEGRFTEDVPFRKSAYLYAEEKRTSEEHLQSKYEAAAQKGKQISVTVLRPAAITGPRGRFMRIRFGLQSALSGQLRGSFVYSVVSRLTAVVPVTPKWCRQFIHEDDVTDLSEKVAFDGRLGYGIFNICPPGPVVLGADMARAVGKRMVVLPPRLIGVVFFFLWHLTRGRIPTGRGAWKGYSYPIVVDGSKLTREYGYQYNYQSLDAFYSTKGRYESFVSHDNRR